MYGALLGIERWDSLYLQKAHSLGVETDGKADDCFAGWSAENTARWSGVMEKGISHSQG